MKNNQTPLRAGSKSSNFHDKFADTKVPLCTKVKITHKLLNSTLYIAMSGELDESTSGYTRETLEAIFDKNKMNKVIIDFSEMSFMDSTGIGVLIGRFKLLKARDIPLLIANPSKTIDKIFSLSGIYQVMPKVVY